jgi:monoamine oxidase
MPRSPLFRKLILALQTARRESLAAQNLAPPLPKSTIPWTRRKFIKTTASVAAAGLAGGCGLSFPIVAEAIPSAPNIAVIGAGIAGLNAAYQLKKAGHSATVYEARSRVGGRILSVNLGNGLIVDLGAELINTDHADMLALAKEFGIELFNRVEDTNGLAFPKEAYYFDGASISESELAHDLRQISDQMTADAALLDQDWDTNAPQFDRLSAADYLALHADKINKPYIFKLFRDVIHTEFGVEPHESSAIQLILVLPVVDGKSVELLSYSDEVYSVVGGSATITNALGTALAGHIKLGMRLKEIKKHGSKYRLVFANQPPVDADIVIVAIPFPVLNGVMLDVKLPNLLRRFINEAKLGANEKVIGSFTNRFWRQMRGFTSAAWSDLGFSEVWDATQRQSSRPDGALNFFLGGNQARQLADIHSITALGKQFVSRLNRFIPGASDATTGRFIHTGWTKSPLTQGGYANFKPGQLTRFGSLLWVESDIPDERQQVSAGNMIFAGEHLSDAFYGFMNGGAQTGRLAATLIVEKIAAATKK